MSFRPVASLAALLSLSFSNAHAAETLPTEVIVRVYDPAGAAAEELHAALKLAASIVSAASLEVIWRTCDRPAQGTARPAAERAGDPCATPLAPGELALRIVRSADAGDRARGLPLGDALIDMHTRSGVLATVYLDRVDRVAALAGVERRSLLGRAIAHELGHLLMSTTDHAARGLMRPVWLRHELRRGEAADWVLEASEVAAIQTRMMRAR